MFNSFGIGIRLDGSSPQDTGPSGPTFRRLRGTVSNVQTVEGAFDAASSGNMIAFTPLDAPRTISTGDQVTFLTDAVKLNFN